MSRPGTRAGPSLPAIDENCPANHGWATAGVAPEGPCLSLRRLRRKLREEWRAEEDRRVCQILDLLEELYAQEERGEITTEEACAHSRPLSRELLELYARRTRRWKALQRYTAAGGNSSDSGDSMGSDEVRRDMAAELEQEAAQAVGEGALVEAAQAGGHGAPPVAAQPPVLAPRPCHA